MRATGGCLCGQIRYEVDSDTFIAVRCHCRDCQYVSGGEPTVAVAFPSNAVRTVKGLARVFNTYADSGTRVFRAFCADCGTPLFSGSEGNPEMIGVKIGSFDDPSRFPPAYHIWVSSAQPWHHIDPTKPAFPKNPSQP
jgi:hypothetical protein